MSISCSSLTGSSMGPVSLREEQHCSMALLPSPQHSPFPQQRGRLAEGHTARCQHMSFRSEKRGVQQ